MGRFYSVNFSAVAVTAAVDVFQVIAPTNKSFHLHEIIISQSSDLGDAQAEGLLVTIKRGIGNTAGSSGSAATPAKHRSIDSASGVTATTNNTSQAAAGAGSLTTLRADGFNIQNGYQYLVAPVQRLFFAGGESCVVSMTAPADSITVSGTLVFEEV